MSSSPITIRCKGILFDMDGILISSLGSVERCWARWCEMRNVDFAYAMTMVHGCRSIESVARLRPDLDAETENQIIEGMEIADTDGIRQLEGVQAFLASLPADRWTVVTSATEPLARVRMNAGNIPVPERFVSAESVSDGKPHPAPYLAGAALLGFQPEECVVFEDAASGSQAGNAAGCTVIATLFSHSAESLAAAHYLVNDLTSVQAKALADGEGLELTLTPVGR